MTARATQTRAELHAREHAGNARQMAAGVPRDAIAFPAIANLETSLVLTTGIQQNPEESSGIRRNTAAKNRDLLAVATQTRTTFQNMNMKKMMNTPIDLGELKFHYRHNYTVTRQLVRRGSRVKIRIWAGNEVIAERTTALPYLCVVIASLDQAFEISSLQDQIAFLLKRADKQDAIQRRAATALADDERNKDPRFPDEAYCECQEQNIQNRWYAQWARKDRDRAAKYKERLDLLKSGPQQEFDKLFAASWHHRRNLALGAPPHAKLEDVLEIDTGLLFGTQMSSSPNP